MGPLDGLKIVEVGGIGPVPFACMLLADMGARVLRIERQNVVDRRIVQDKKFQYTLRGRASCEVNLKDPAGIELVLRLLESADALVEGFRPGVMERFGISPDVCLARNPRLVFCRMTGWGQDGPLANVAGHDINYLALAGALHSIGRANAPPTPPLNLVGDFGGGALYLALGLTCAILESSRSGRGQIVDVAMVDGVASLLTAHYGLLASGEWTERRGENLFDSGAPWYDVYECQDGKYVAVGAIEDKFYDQLIGELGLDRSSLPSRSDRANWPKLRERFAAVFKSKTRDEWAATLESAPNVCVTPVLTPTEAIHHPHARAREQFIKVDGQLQPGPAPRFSRTTSETGRPQTKLAEEDIDALLDWGISRDQSLELRRAGTLR